MNGSNRTKPIARAAGIFLALLYALAPVRAEDTVVARRGDSLSLLAERHLGARDRWREIADANAIPPPYLIREGQILRLPSPAAPAETFPETAPTHGIPAEWDTHPPNCPYLAEAREPGSSSHSFMRPSRDPSATQPASQPSSQPASRPAEAAPRAEGDLESLLAVVREKNREIRAARDYAEAAEARIRPAGSLEDPTLGVGYMDMFEDFPQYGKDPLSNVWIQVEQMFPGPGKREIRREIARHFANHHASEVNVVTLRVESEVKKRWWEIYRITAEREILEHARENLRSFTAGVEARYRAGEGTQAEVLRAGVEITMITERLRMLEREERGEAAMLNALLDRDPATPLPRPSTRPVGDISLSVEDMAVLARDSCPLIVGMQHMLMHHEAQVRLAQAERLPDWGVEAGVLPRGDLPTMWSLGFKITLPIRQSERQDEWVREARAELRGAENDLEAHWRDVRARIEDLAAQAEAARDLVRLYDSAIVPQAELAVLSAIPSYESGRIDFATVTMSIVSLRQNEVERVRRRAEFHQAVAELEALVARRLEVR